jgi:hypothetical protein
MGRRVLSFRPLGVVAVPTLVAEMIRNKLAVGTLPHDDPVRLRAGRGSGSPCAGCGEPILGTEPEYAPQYNDPRPVVRFHGRCYGIWDAERYPRLI